MKGRSAGGKEEAKEENVKEKKGDTCISDEIVINKEKKYEKHE